MTYCTTYHLSAVLLLKSVAVSSRVNMKQVCEDLCPHPSGVKRAISLPGLTCVCHRLDHHMSAVGFSELL